MRTFQEAMADVLAFTPQAFAALGAHLKPEWFIEALAAGAGGQEQVETRRRKLPVDRVLWLVIGMGLFRDRSIQEVVEHLGISLLKSGPKAGIAPSAIPQARERLGVDPVQYLFDLTADHWAHSHAKSAPWRGLSVYGLDGTCLRVPDTAENEATFGKPQGGRASSGYPQVRLVGLMALRSHTLAGISIGGFREGEMTLAEPLWKKIPDQSLTIVDRGFLAWGPLYRLHAEGKERHWLIRAKSNLKWRKLKTLGPGDLLVEVRPSSKARREYPELPKVFQVRVISYRMKGYRPQKLITSMLDPVTYPAIEIAKLYHERWELEIGYDELKTHMLEREESLRSRKPEGVLQEVAGIAIAYNLVRVEMSRVAEELNLEPTRLSFRHALMLIRNFCVAAWSVSPEELPRRLGSLDADLRLLVLPERRPERRYGRHVKIKMSGYARNRGKSARAA